MIKGMKDTGSQRLSKFVCCYQQNILQIDYIICKDLLLSEIIRKLMQSKVFWKLGPVTSMTPKINRNNRETEK